MSQHSNEHLTITQLSAYRDQEMAADEHALCQAHLQTCQDCQHTLAEIKLTASLLRSLPQVEVPRSFALPDNFLLNQPAAQPRREKSQTGERQRWRYALRSISALAAVLGLLFILFGLSSNISLGVPTASNSSGLARPSDDSQTRVASTTTASEGSGQTSPSITQSTSTATKLPTPLPPGQGNQAGNATGLPLSQSAGDLGVGFLLLLPGIVGILLSLRHRQRLRRDQFQ